MQIEESGLVSEEHSKMKTDEYILLIIIIKIENVIWVLLKQR